MPETPDARLQSLIAAAPRWPDLDAPLPAARMPRHVAIIMDGNGRWATRQGKLRVNGHRAGVDSVRDITRFCGQVHIQALTLYAFSTENWKRPQAEIRFLFRLLRKYLVAERAELIANGVRLTSIGNTAALPEDVQAELRRTQDLTSHNRGLNLCLALNYGAHDEILHAAQALISRARDGEIQPDDIDENMFEAQLFTAGMPPLDLLIRTAGERRLSNFLLWQASHAHFHETPVCWPEFRRDELTSLILEYDRTRAVAAE